MSGQPVELNQSAAMPANSGRPVKLRQSCDACSGAKVKCTKESPSCSRCNANNLKCVYGESRRFGRISSKKRAASRDSSSIDLNKDTAPVQLPGHDIEPPFHHNELWPPDFPFPFENSASNPVNHGEGSLVCSGDSEASMSGKEPHTGSENSGSSRHPSNPWAIAMDFQNLPSGLVPPTQGLSTAAYDKASLSIGSNTPPAFENLGNRPRPPLPRRASETILEQPHPHDRNKQSGLHNVWTENHVNPTRAAEPQLQDKLMTNRHTLEQSDWPRPGQCDRCRSSAAKPQPSADDIFRTNRVALQQVSRMLTCECGKDAHLAMLFATILQRVLAGYRTIIESGATVSAQAKDNLSTAHSSPLTQLSNPSEAPAVPQRWDTPIVPPGTGNIPVRYGSFSLDQGDVDLLRQALAHGGLRKAEQVVLQMEALHANFCANSCDASGIDKPDNTTSDDEAHVAELYKLLSGWLKSDIRKTLERLNAS